MQQYRLGDQAARKQLYRKTPKCPVGQKLNSSQQHILIAKKAFMHWAVLTELQPTGVRKWLFRPLRVLHSSTVSSFGLRRARHWNREPENRMNEERLKELTLFSLMRRLKRDGRFVIFNYWMALYTEKRDRGTPGEDDSNKMQHLNFQLIIRKKEIITVRVATHWNRGPVRPLEDLHPHKYSKLV